MMRPCARAKKNISLNCSNQNGTEIKSSWRFSLVLFDLNHYYVYTSQDAEVMVPKIPQRIVRTNLFCFVLFCPEWMGMKDSSTIKSLT